MADKRCTRTAEVRERQVNMKTYPSGMTLPQMQDMVRHAPSPPSHGIASCAESSPPASAAPKSRPKKMTYTPTTIASTTASSPVEPQSSGHAPMHRRVDPLAERHQTRPQRGEGGRVAWAEASGGVRVVQ